MADYSRQLATAERMIRSRGMPVVYVQVAETGSYDPVSDSYAKAEVQIPAWGVRSAAGVKEVQAYGFSTGSTVLYMAASEVTEPKTGDYLLFSGHKWNIRSIAATAPAETPVLFALELSDGGEADA